MDDKYIAECLKGYGEAMTQFENEEKLQSYLTSVVESGIPIVEILKYIDDFVKEQDEDICLSEIVVTKNKPNFVNKHNKQEVEYYEKNSLFSRFEYIVQSTGYSGDSYSGVIARKIKSKNLYVTAHYEC